MWSIDLLDIGICRYLIIKQTINIIASVLNFWICVVWGYKSKIPERFIISCFSERLANVYKHIQARVTLKMMTYWFCKKSWNSKLKDFFKNNWPLLVFRNFWLYRSKTCIHSVNLRYQQTDKNIDVEIYTTEIINNSSMYTSFKNMKPILNIFLTAGKKYAPKVH